jgi:hypothetical protein
MLPNERLFPNRRLFCSSDAIKNIRRFVNRRSLFHQFRANGDMRGNDDLLALSRGARAKRISSDDS